MANEGGNNNPNPGLTPEMVAALQTKNPSGIPQKWLDEMLNVSKTVLPKEVAALRDTVKKGNESIVSKLTTQNQALESLNKSMGLSFQNTLIDALKKYDKDYGAKEEDKKHTDRKTKDDKDATDRNKKLSTDLSTQLKDKISSTATGPVGAAADLEGAAAAEAALKETKAQPVMLESISSGALRALKSILAPGAADGVEKEKEKTKANTTTTTEGTGIIAALGKSLGTGIKTLAEAFGTGIEAIGKGIGGFLSGIGVGLKVLGPGLAALANPEVAIGLGLVILAINGIALAFRLAAPAIQAAMPFFIRIADVIGKVLMHAIDKIPDMLKAIGVAIGTVLKMAGPTIIELAKVIGTYVIAVIKEVGITIANLAKIAGPIIIEIVKTVKDALVQLAPFVVQLVMLIKEAVIAIAPYVTQIVKAVMEAVKAIVPQLVELGRIIKDVLVGAFNLLKPVLLGLLPIIDKLITFLGDALIKALNIVGPVLKDLAETLKIAVAGISNILSGIINFATHLVDDIKSIFASVSETISGITTFATHLVDNIRDIFTSGINGVKSIVAIIGYEIRGTVEEIGAAIIGVINSVADTIERIAAVGGAKLRDAAGGITAVAVALGGFAAGGLAAGAVSFFTGDNNPLKQLMKIAENSANFSTIPPALNAIKQSISDINGLKVNLDPLNSFIDVLKRLKDTLSDTAGGLFSSIISKTTGTGPFDQLIAFTDRISSMKDSIAPLKDLVGAINAIDIAKAAAFSAALAVSTSAAAATPVTPTPNNFPPVVQTETGPALPVTLVSAKIASEEAAKLNTLQTTSDANKTVDSETLKYYSIQFAVTSRMLTELEHIRTAVENGALANKESVANTASNINKTTTSIVNNSSTTAGSMGNNSIRDIPYIERSKYRRDMIYNRGLL